MSDKLKFTPIDIEKLYKDQSERYSNFAKDSFSWNYLEKPLIDKFIKSIDITNFKILDAGCGTGRTINYLINKGVNIENITGVDISEEMLEITKKNVPDIINIFKKDLTKYKTTNKFDLIFCTHVLHYLDEKDFLKTLKNFNKLLKPEGILFFINTHPITSVKDNLSKYFKNDWIIDFTPWGTRSPLFLRTVSDLVNKTIKAGFNIMSIEEPYPPLSAKKANLTNFLKYSECPKRIAIIAKKS